MGRGGTIYLSYTALVLLSAASGASAGLWDVDIDLDPAPAPDKGPPFSAHAVRDRSQLPYELAGILGAYVGFTLILGTLILTVGRRLRKQAQAMAERPTEMVTQSYKAYGKSPISPGKSSLMERIMNKGRNRNNNYGSPGMVSVASFDQNVVQRDRQRQQDDLAEIYAHVLQEDEQGPPPGYPVNRTVDRLRSEEAYAGPQSPTSPKSPGFVPVYPKNYNGPTSPYYYEQPQSPLRANRDTRTTSFGSNQTGETTISSPGKLRKGVRKLKDHGLTISAPLRRDNNSDGARTPLSPRTYTDPGVPPEPPTAGTTNSQYPPTTPGTARTFESDTLPVAREPPSAYPQHSQPARNEPKAPTVTTSGDFIMPVPPKRSTNSPVSGTNNPLPLRAMNDQLKQQQSQQDIYKKTFPLSPAAMSSPTSAALRSPAAAMAGSMRSPGALLSPTGMKSPAIIRQEIEYGSTPWRGAPGTAGPKTPYSPYMREAMLTPIMTPHLTTRAERKQREKEEKTIRGAITEEDQVVDDKDMWDDAY
ncbi:hypothetical protein AC578_1926 [Pseudocercospora eumusae]|uniref:Uncharacterized protein n=1 Tax=Pseudocercospora eumusae TaxID=321146 RepID=A0A139HDD7_9PEZI|nr:hypothetical protein AC578_1926 [Pseudocercospora eumusae]